MLLEERIETTSVPKIFHLQVTFGLDTAEEHRLLDQRMLLETNCPVSSGRNNPLDFPVDFIYTGMGCSISTA